MYLQILMVVLSCFRLSEMLLEHLMSLPNWKGRSRIQWTALQM